MMSTVACVASLVQGGQHFTDTDSMKQEGMKKQAQSSMREGTKQSSMREGTRKQSSMRKGMKKRSSM